MDDEFLHDFGARLGYRFAYGLAARLAAIAGFPNLRHRDVAAAISWKPDAIEKEVMRRVGTKTDPWIVKLAVADALAKREPRC